MILLGDIANTLGVCVLAADKRGNRNVFQAGSCRRAWLWRRMKNSCWWEAQRGRGCCCGRAQRRTLTFCDDATWASSLACRSLHHIHYKTCGWGKEEPCDTGNRATKGEKQESWGKQRGIGCFAHSLLSQQIPSKKRVPVSGNPMNRNSKWRWEMRTAEWQRKTLSCEC